MILYCKLMYTIENSKFIFVYLMFTIQVYHIFLKNTYKISKKAGFKVKTKPFNITFIILNGFVSGYNYNFYKLTVNNI